MRRPVLFRLLLAMLLAGAPVPLDAGNGYITTCEGMGCYGHGPLCAKRQLLNGTFDYCYYPN